MYVVKEIYYYPDLDGYQMDSLNIVAYTETKEDAEAIKELRCKEIRIKECYEPTGTGMANGGCYLLNDMSPEEQEDLDYDWNCAYWVFVREVKTVSADEWANKRDIL